MEVALLGPLEVHVNGRAVDLGRPKQRAVLAVLVIHANQIVSLDRLIDLLWGEEVPARATAALQAYVSNLRRVLEPARGARRSPEVLITRAPGYLLKVSPDRIDAARFETLTSSGRRLLAEGRSHAARQALVEALGLWRGPALAEFAYERFAQPEAARLEELHHLAVEGRLEADMALGGHTAAVAELQSAVKEHPLRERLWGLLMLALYRSGRQGEALRAYGEARTVLADELGIDPTPALRRLEAEILTQAPSLDWRLPQQANPRQQANPPPQASRNATALMPAMGAAGPTPPRPVKGGGFVGRDGPLGQLRSAWDQARAGRGGLVLVSGEAGIGKTRLLEELTAQVTAEDGVVAWGAGYEGEGAPAFWPWTQIVRSLTSAGAIDNVESDTGLLPALIGHVLTTSAVTAPGPPTDPAQARFLLFEAATSRLLSVATTQPVLIVLDDLQWADVASLQLLEFLAPRLGSTSLLVVVTHRDGTDAAQLAETLGSLARNRTTGRLVLSGLGPDQVGLFLTATAAHASADLAAALHERTEGNPFFVRELVCLLEAEGTLDEAAARTSPVPLGVRDVIRRRLARLPAPTRTLLGAAAVIGRDFDLDLAAMTASDDLETAVELLEAPVMAGLVVEDTSRPGSYRFSHDLIRQTIYEGISSPRRTTLHYRLAASLEQHPSAPCRLTELANHFFHAAPLAGPECGLAYTLRAAEAAQAALAYEQAEKGLRRALTLIELLPVGTRGERELQVQNRLIALMIWTRGYAAPEVGWACARARQLCQEIGETDDLLKTLGNLHRFHYIRGELSVAAEFAGQVLSVGERRANPLWLAAGYYFVGVAQFHTGLFREARDSFASLRQAAASLALSSDVAECFSGLHPLPVGFAYSAWTAWLLGEEAEAHALSQEGVELATRLGDPHTLAPTWFGALQLNVAARRVTTVLALSERALTVCDEHGMAGYRGWLRLFRGWALSEQGCADEGVAEMTAAVAIHRATGSRLNTHVFLALLAEGEARRGNLARALALVDEALAVSGEDHLWEADLHRRRGELLGAQGPGHHEAATAALQTALAVADSQGAVSFKRRAEAALANLTQDNLAQ